VFTRFVYGLVLAAISAAGGFSIIELSSQEHVALEAHDEAIAVAVLEAELAYSHEIDPQVAASEVTLIAENTGEEMAQSADTVGALAALVEPGQGTNFIGEVEILSPSVLSLTLEGGEALLVWLGDGLLDAAAIYFPEFRLETGDFAEVTGYWSDSGSYIADTITGLESGVTLDLNLVRTAAGEEAAAVETAAAGQGMGNGQGQGQGYRGGR